MRPISVLAVIALALAAACAPKAPPAIAVAPHYPEFMFPELSPPDPRQAPLEKGLRSGWQQLQAGDLVRAERSFQNVLKRSPAFYPAETALGYVEAARNSPAAAVQHFDRVLGERPAYVPALVGKGNAALALSDIPGALAAFQAAVGADASLVELARRVDVLKARMAQENVAAAREAAQTGRLDDARHGYEQAIATSPESAFLYRDLAEVEMKQGLADQALQHYRRALALDPNDPATLVHIGEILDARGDSEGAMASYTSAYRLDPRQEIRRRISALEARIAYLRLPAEYRALPDQPAITRGDLAALDRHPPETARRLGAGRSRPSSPIRANHWASGWIMAVVGAGVMDAV